MPEGTRSGRSIKHFIDITFAFEYQIKFEANHAF